MQRQTKREKIPQAAPPRPRDGRTTVVMTGFGPFPSVPVNASMILVPRLAKAAASIFPATRFVTEILPTEWDTAPKRVDALLSAHAPDLILHFGVSSRARGFEIEQRGRNECALAPDASGCCPDDAEIRSGGPHLIRSRLPVAEIVTRLRDRGIPAFRSWNAGTYLCNATLYHVLLSTRGQNSMAGFVHIPAALAPPGSAAAPMTTKKTSPNSPLTWAQALDGGLAILATCLGRPNLPSNLTRACRGNA
jgi:pyroglutamyl-peptidase